MDTSDPSAAANVSADGLNVPVAEAVAWVRQLSAVELEQLLSDVVRGEAPRRWVKVRPQLRERPNEAA